MHDMNFFAPMLAKGAPKKHGFLLKFAIGLITISILAAPISLFAFTYVSNSRIAEIKEVLSKPENVAIMSELQRKENRLAAFNTLIPQLSGRDNALQSVEWFNEELFQIAIDCFPKQARMITFNLLPMADSKDSSVMNAIEINGIASDKPAVAELEYNLRKVGRFEDIIVSTIEEKDGILSYSVKFSVKEGGAR